MLLHIKDNKFGLAHVKDFQHKNTTSQAMFYSTKYSESIIKCT